MNFDHIDFGADAVGCPYLALVLLSPKVDLKRILHAGTRTGDSRDPWDILVVDSEGEKSWWIVYLNNGRVRRVKSS